MTTTLRALVAHLSDAQVVVISKVCCERAYGSTSCCFAQAAMDAAAAAGGAAAPKRTFLCGKEGSARLAVLHLLGTQFIAEMRAAVVPALRLAADVSQVELFVARADEKGRLYPAGPPLADAQDIDAAFAASLQPFVCVIAKQPEGEQVHAGCSGGPT